MSIKRTLGKALIVSGLAGIVTAWGIIGYHVAQDIKSYSSTNLVSTLDSDKIESSKKRKDGHLRCQLGCIGILLLGGYFTGWGMEKIDEENIREYGSTCNPKYYK